MKQELCTTIEESKCVKEENVSNSKCIMNCEGMDVISYDEFDIMDTVYKYSLQLSKIEIFDQKFFKPFNTNFKLNKLISKLSDFYSKYKEDLDFPPALKSMYSKNHS